MTPVFNPLYAYGVALDISLRAHESTAALVALQQTRLVRLLAAAVLGSAFYRESLCHILNEVKTAATLLGSLPIVTKRQLMSRFDDWVTDPQIKLSRLQQFLLESGNMGVPFLGKYLIWESSGTSNQPGIFVQDAQAMAVYDALESLRVSRPQSDTDWLDPLSLTRRVAFVGVTTGHFASIVSIQRWRQLNPLLAQQVRCFSILQSTQSLVSELNAFAPTVIATYPTAALVLAEEAARGTLRFLPQEVWTGGENLSTAVRQRVASQLGCAVRNSYGASEFMSIGWECKQGRMHVNADWVILEPVDEQGCPVPLGSPSHTTVLTNLANHAQPLIRYDMGDQITLRREPCICGSHLPVIEVQGRCDESLHMMGQDGQLVSVLPLALTTVLEDDAGVFEFQLCQKDARTWLLRLQSDLAGTSEIRQRCLEVLERFAVNQGLAPVHVVVECVTPVARGRSGKVQRVFSALWGDRH